MCGRRFDPWTALSNVTRVSVSGARGQRLWRGRGTKRDLVSSDGGDGGHGGRSPVVEYPLDRRRTLGATRRGVRGEVGELQEDPTGNYRGSHANTDTHKHTHAGIRHLQATGAMAASS